MTTDAYSTETEVDPTARYMGQRLSALPASIRAEVIEAVADVVDLFTNGSIFLEAVAARKVAAVSEGARQREVEYHVVMLLYFHARVRFKDPPKP